MNYIELTVYIGLFVLFYSYVGYGILLFIIVRIKELFCSSTPVKGTLQPVTLVVAAFNEADFIEKKILNSFLLNYPESLLDLVFVTDGSTDGTPEIVSRYPRIRLLHQPRRSGKMAAMHRAMAVVRTPFVVFSDANTLLNTESIRNIMQHYHHPKVGGVAGEKKILPVTGSDTAGAAEGLYWRYESWLKQMDWRLYTVVGAAGELFSLRTQLYEAPPADTLLDDFILSLQVCRRGYRVAYEAEAFAMELPSASLNEERKRKVRIGAGAFQSMVRMRTLLNPFKFPVTGFQYLSHRVLRWALCPFLLPVVLLSTIALAVQQPTPVHLFLLSSQLLLYVLGLCGWYTSKKNARVGILYAAFYFLFINWTMYLGLLRYLRGSQTVLWEKAVRQPQNHVVKV